VSTKSNPILDPGIKYWPFVLFFWSFFGFYTDNCNDNYSDNKTIFIREPEVNPPGLPQHWPK